jgi:RNA polymerase sigma-70 factor (ECF subfamily)
MSPSGPAFEELLSRLRSGDKEAADEIFNRFAHSLIALARQRLGSIPPSKVEPEDIIQSVFNSFFQRHASEAFDLGGWDSLWGLLTIITLRKCGRYLRYYHRSRRNIAREVDGETGCEAITREPTPEEAATLNDLVGNLMHSLDDRDQEIIGLSLQGYSVTEISELVERSERTVYRVLERTRKRLVQIRDHGADRD